MNTKNHTNPVFFLHTKYIKCTKNSRQESLLVYIIQHIKEMYHIFGTYDRAQSYVWYQSEFIHDEKEEQDEVFTHGWTWTISTRIA